MAIIICPECNNQVSSMAGACPRCGYPIAGRSASEGFQSNPVDNEMSQKISRVDPQLAKEFYDFENEYSKTMNYGLLNSASAKAIAILMRSLNEKMVFCMISANCIGEVQIESAFRADMPGKEYNQGSAQAAIVALRHYGVVSQDTYNSMDQIRFWGNKAAHGDAQVTEQNIRSNYAHLKNVVNVFCNQQGTTVYNHTDPVRTIKNGKNNQATVSLSTKIIGYIFIVIIVIALVLMFWSSFSNKQNTYTGQSTSSNKQNTYTGQSTSSNNHNYMKTSSAYETYYYYTMNVGDYLSPGAAVWQGSVDIDDDSIVSVDSNLILHALKKGTTEVTYHGIGSMKQSYTIVVE